MVGIARAGLVAALALAASGCEALALAADGVVLGLHAAGDTVAYCDGGEPLAPEELPEWARRVEPLTPTPELLREAASTIQGDPRRRGTADLYELFSPLKATSLKLYGIGPLLPPPYKQNDQFFLWDGEPGHRLLYHRRSGFYDFSFILGYGSTESRSIDDSTAGQLPTHRDGDFISIPYSGTWCVRPAGRPLAESLEKIVTREIEGEATKFRLENTHRILFGVLGWGRINRTRYLQVLWIPIPVGRAEAPPEHP